jgi:three-Cys-motif partner protein
MSEPKQSFGGSWTAEKLERLRKYLAAYTQALKAQPFELAYVDAFAGTGYNTEKARPSSTDNELFEEFRAPEVLEFVDGSARIALKIEPPFHRYVFIEKDQGRFAELEKLKNEFPEHRDRIRLVNEDANTYLQRICKSASWDRHRAAVFLDPFGMQVSWETIAAIAATKVMDLWLLFPVGMAVNRLITRDGKMMPGWHRRLTDFFGTDAWEDEFYHQEMSSDLFETPRPTITKTANLKAIGDFFNKRLAEVFADVAPNPLPLRNSSGMPLFLLCFAVSNPSPKARKLPLKIAKDVLKP